MNADPDEYRNRNHLLRDMGFASYREYLASDLWARIRAEVFRQKGVECFLCGGVATQLHHNRYRMQELTGEKIKEIKPVCRSCHENIEFFMGSKNTMAQAKAWFHRMRRARTKSQRKQQ